MKKQQSIKHNPYNDSLSKIFFRSGLTVFVFLSILWFLFGVILLLSRRVDEESGKIMLFSFVMVILCSYTSPLFGLYHTLQQQHCLGIYWRNRTAHSLSENQQDWYLDFINGGFLLIHRTYIKQILSSTTKLEASSHSPHHTVYYILFEDIKGKKHTLKFYTSSDLKHFRNWYSRK